MIWVSLASALVKFFDQLGNQRFHLDREGLYSAGKSRPGDQREDGDGQSDDGCAKALADTGGDPFQVSSRRHTRADIRKYFHQTRDGAKEAEKGRDTDDDLKDEQ